MLDTENLIAQVKAAGRNLTFAGPQSETSIESIERSLGCALPPSYRAFLRQFGAGGESGAWIAGIYDDQPLMEGVGSVYGETILARERHLLPMNFVVVYSDSEMGALWCLDNCRNDAAREAPVVSIDIGSGKVDNILAASFGDFFREYLTIRTQRRGTIAT